MVPAHDAMVRTEPQPPFKLWVRGTLLVLAAGVVGVFAIAAWLKPYEADGRPRLMATHSQLGLPPCNFVRLCGMPCPTCGMTTSFALLMHGDPVASMRANFAGTLLAVMLLVGTPWVVLSAVSGYWRGVRWPERWILGGAILVGVVTIGRWLVLVALPWLFGFG